MDTAIRKAVLGILFMAWELNMKSFERCFLWDCNIFLVYSSIAAPRKMIVNNAELGLNS